MTFTSHLGTSPVRTDAPAKTGGTLRFTDDPSAPAPCTPPCCSAPRPTPTSRSIDTAAAAAAPGVRGVFTGADWPDTLIGLYMGDKPPLARGKVRHHGEPVVAVVADDEASALNALRLVKVEYAPLPALGSPRAAMAKDAPILHPDLGTYARIPDILPEPGTNVANRTIIRKGDPDKAFAEAEVVVEGEFSFPPGDHVAMEPRVAIAEYGLDGRLEIDSSTQSPFEVRNLLAKALDIPERRSPCGRPRWAAASAARRASCSNRWPACWPCASPAAPCASPTRAKPTCCPAPDAPACKRACASPRVPTARCWRPTSSSCSIPAPTATMPSTCRAPPPSPAPGPTTSRT